MPPAAVRPWAAATAVLLHLLPLAWLWPMPAPPRFGAIATGSGGIEVALAPASGAAAPAESGTSQAEAVEAVSAVEPAAAVPAQPAPVEPIEPVATTEQAPTAPAATASAVVPAPPKPKPRPAVAQARRQPEPATAAKPAATPEPRAAAPAAAPSTAETGTANVADAGRAAPDAARGGPGGGPASAPGQAAQTTPGGGHPGAAPDYLARLVAWLERHKEYPPASRLRREEGVALLRFAIDRDGRLLDWRIERSSGREPLDRAVAAMVRRAAPFPAMPADLPQGRLELTVPVQFRLR